MPDPAARDVIKTLTEKRMASLADQYAKGELSLQDWQIAMRDEVRRAYALQLIAGNDGQQPAADDWLRLGSVVKSQDGYLEDFAHSLGDLSPEGIASRSMLYARSAQSAYWNQAYPDMPAQPCDGSSECLSNCGCSWKDNGDGSYTWELGKSDNCPTCSRRAQEWNPYIPEAA